MSTDADGPSSRATRRVDPPVPVLVDLSRWVIHRPEDQMIGRVPMWLRTGGWNFTDSKTQGMLHGWLRSCGGSWVGIVELQLHTGDGQSLAVSHLCPGSSITPL